MNTIFFEWAEYEQVLSDSEKMEWGDVSFESEAFDLKKAEGFTNISIFIKSKISNSDLDTLIASGLKKISIRAVGFDMLDVEYAKSIGIGVFRVASYSPRSIAEHVFALLLTLSRKILIERKYHIKNKNEWSMELLGFTLSGKTMGIFGVGRIGTEVAKIAEGFDMKVVYVDKYADPVKGWEKLESLNELFSLSDVVSLNVPLKDETRGIINSDVLSYAKPGLILINTSRGDIVNSDDAFVALESGNLGGLGIDVWDGGEVDDRFDPRLLRDDVIQTYHVGFFTKEAIIEILRQTEENLFGKPTDHNTL